MRMRTFPAETHDRSLVSPRADQRQPGGGLGRLVLFA